MERFTDTKLPSKDDFKNSLTGEVITDKDYQRVQLMWKLFNCRTLKDYHDIYLKIDVILLADVFEKFRQMCINTYKLDPTHYFSAPGLAFDAALKMSGIKLELFTDIDKHLFIENSIRGGVSMISHRPVSYTHLTLPTICSV